MKAFVTPSLLISSAASMQHGNKQTVGIRDNRPATATQKSLQLLIDSRAQTVVQRMTHTVEEVKGNEAAQLKEELEAWLVYAKELLKAHPGDELYESDQRKEELGDAYYNNQDTAFRKAHKELAALHSDLSGAETEIKNLLKEVDKSSDYVYLVAKKDGVIQGILQAHDDYAFIANIVVNPNNIVPKPGKTQVKNTLRDLMQSLIEHNLAWEDKQIADEREEWLQEQKEEKNSDSEGEPEEKPEFKPTFQTKNIELCALSSRVKKIYAHYGFQVRERSYSKSLVERPVVERDANKWRTLAAKQTSESIKGTHKWFAQDRMAMTDAGKKDFLNRYS